MPNLLNINTLRENYSGNTYQKKQIEIALNEAFDIKTRLKKSFSYQNINSHILTYFEDEKTANVVLLFIDICNFSNKCKFWTSNNLSEYLDDYYDMLIPLIYQYGGEVEKVIGDGVICTFGEPFLRLNIEKLLERADMCAKEIIIQFMETDKEVKIALHDGEVMYYKNKSHYLEYTMIGNPLTELFRLEGISENNSINYYAFSKYDKKNFGSIDFYTSEIGEVSIWKKSNPISINLKGVDKKFMHFKKIF